MQVHRRFLRSLAAAAACAIFLPLSASAATLTVELNNGSGVTAVGAINRFDQDGNLRRPVDPKAVIDQPQLDARATNAGSGRWVFQNLQPGKYDLVIFAGGKVRIEGFQYAPVLEFDPFVDPTATVEDDDRDFVFDHVKNSRHYENKVVPLYVAGDDKVIRVLVMLIRDQATSYTPGAGTIRHEIWQYSWQYGGWVKEKRTRVIDRLLLQVSELRRWTWLWDSKLGGIELKSQPVTLQYELPTRTSPAKLQGLYPY